MTTEERFLFGRPDVFAIEIELRGRRNRRVLGSARIWLDGEPVGNPDTVKVKDVAEIFDESRYYLEYSDGGALADLSAQEALETVWNDAHAGDPPKAPGLVEELWGLDRHIWLEGIESFDGWQTAFLGVGDQVRFLWRELGESEVREAFVDREEYLEVVQEFGVWSETVTQYRLWEPRWAKRMRGRRGREDRHREELEPVSDEFEPASEEFEPAGERGDSDGRDWDEEE